MNDPVSRAARACTSCPPPATQGSLPDQVPALRICPFLSSPYQPLLEATSDLSALATIPGVRHPPPPQIPEQREIGKGVPPRDPAQGGLEPGEAMVGPGCCGPKVIILDC